MKTLLFIPMFALMSSLTLNGYGQDGATIFKKNCGVCHTIGKGKVVGPDLKGVDKKYETKWLIEWITSSQKMINEKKDPIAIKVFNENNQMVMPDQAVSEEEIKTLLAFIGDETAKLDQPPVAAATSNSPTAVQSQSGQVTDESSNSNQMRVSSSVLIYILIGIIVFLTAVIIRLAKVIKEIALTQKSNKTEETNNN